MDLGRESKKECGKKQAGGVRRPGYRSQRPRTRTPVSRTLYITSDSPRQINSILGEPCLREQSLEEIPNKRIWRENPPLKGLLWKSSFTSQVNFNISKVSR